MTWVRRFLLDSRIFGSLASFGCGVGSLGVWCGIRLWILVRFLGLAWVPMMPLRVDSFSTLLDILVVIVPVLFY